VRDEHQICHSAMNDTDSVALQAQIAGFGVAGAWTWL
jgi:hypothetical protein